MFELNPIQRKPECPIPGACVSCKPGQPADEHRAMSDYAHLDPVDQELAQYVPVADPAELPKAIVPVLGKNLTLSGLVCDAVRLDLVDSKLQVRAPLTDKLIRDRFLAGATVVVNAWIGDEVIPFLELQLSTRGLEIEDLESLDPGEPVELELVATIDSYRYLSAESAL